MIVGHIGGSSSGGYEIQKSLRFRASASAYLSRTPGSSGSQTTCTWSGWLKRTPGVAQPCFSATLGAGGYNDNVSWFQIGYDDTPSIVNFVGNVFQCNLGNANYKMRDPSAWYHIVFQWNTTNATAALRARAWVNGVELALSGTQPAQNNTAWFNAATCLHTIGKDARNAQAGHWDGYLSEVNFIDGQALDPSYFGQVSAETGSWIPKKYTGTYGTNGFYLPFNDGSTLANLAADRSGNGNNWTANNISLTSGSSYDWMDDTPTNNFATLNPLFPADDCTFSEGNLKFAYGSAPVPTTCFGSFGMSSGEWYWTTTITANSSGTTSALILGITNKMARLPQYPGYDSNGWGYYGDTGVVYNNASTVAFGASFGVGDVIGLKFNADTGTMRWYKQTAGTGSFVLQATIGGFPAGTYYPAFGDGGGVRTGAASVNFGQYPISNTTWLGLAKALCTKNLPTPSILNPKKHFDVVLATGANIKSTVEALYSDQALMVVKDRANANNWQWFNDVTGLSAILQSNTTSAETTYSAPTGSSVGYGWKAGGAPVTNNAGSIQSQVSANPQAGFSVVTYTGTGANATVGHGLGVAPKMMLFKGRNVVSDWVVYHANIGNTGALVLNQTIATSTSINYWNNTSPTSSVFTIGIAGGVNNSSSNTYVAYCFAAVPGYSAFGSYTGNGSADGPFVYCGFRPRFIMVKGSSLISEWYVWDSARNTYNVANLTLNPNQSAAEYGAGALLLDLTANGFKVRDAVGSWNTSGYTYIFYAIAEQPFQFANAR